MSRYKSDALCSYTEAVASKEYGSSSSTSDAGTGGVFPSTLLLGAWPRSLASSAASNLARLLGGSLSAQADCFGDGARFELDIL